jgi:hypothetical protein
LHRPKSTKSVKKRFNFETDLDEHSLKQSYDKVRKKLITPDLDQLVKGLKHQIRSHNRT